MIRNTATTSLLTLTILFTTTLAGAQVSEPDATILHALSEGTPAAGFGWVVARIGDLDGDGAPELLVPAPWTVTTGNNTGRVYVYSGASGTVLHTVNGDPEDLLGYSVGDAGDVNGDGTPDYIVGGTGGTSATRPGRAIVLSGADHSVLYDLAGDPGSAFGSAVTGAGDVDGDGFGDFLVGAERSSGATQIAGAVLMYSGADGSLLWRREGTFFVGKLGSAAGRVGDVTGDGIDDVVVGASGEGATNGGQAYVLSGPDGAIVHTLLPVPTAVVFGEFFASGAGDINGDGWPDVFVGDYADADRATLGTGRGYVFNGRTGRLMRLLWAERPGDGFGIGRGVGDLDGDGFGDLILAAWTNSDGAPAAGKAYLVSGRSGAVMRTFTGTIAGDNFGVDAASAGDVNGDGRTDFVVTAVGHSFAGTAPGSVYVIAGSDLPCVGDLDGDDVVGPADLGLLASAWTGGGAPGAADMDRNGALNRRDAIMLVQEFGRCHSPGKAIPIEPDWDMPELAATE